MSDNAALPVCDLCGLDLPPRPPETEWNNTVYRFCCSGCLQVFSILAESGLLEGDYKQSDIYQTSLELGIIGQVEQQGSSRKKKSDKEPLTEEQLAQSKEMTLQVGGMWCSACSWLIDKVVGGQQGVLETRVLFAADTATIRYLPQDISAERIKESINKLGYTVSLRSELSGEAEKQRGQLLLRMGIALFIAVNIMMLNAVLYVGYFETLTMDMAGLVPLILWFFATPAVFWCGLSIHRKGFRSLMAGAPTMELLLSTGILTAYFYSIYIFFQGGTHIYFDTSANLVALVLVGKFFETSARHKAGGTIQRLYGMLPKKVRLKTARGERLTAIDQLKSGDIFVVKPGEKIPGDGMIVKGNTSVDESLLTGESTPVSKKEGMAVVGSAMNLNGLIEVEATNIGADTTLSRIIKMVEGALMGKSRIQELVDRVSRWFIPFVFFLCVATVLFLYLNGGSLEAAIMRGLTVLVIACPCALGIATPLALMAGIGYGARKGILVKDGSMFQRASELNHIFFDKTGTITSGQFAVVHHQCMGDDSGGHTHAQLVAALEKGANHPIATAFMNWCHEKKIKGMDAEDVTFHEGMGVTGLVNGKEVVAGNRKLFTFSERNLPEKLLIEGTQQESMGHTVIFYYLEELSAFGFYVLGDRLKENVPQLVKQLQDDGFSLRLISGDSERTTAAIAKRAGIDNYAAELSPADKIAEIKKAQANNERVAMIGDGINDAPALAQSDTGIAIGSGTELAMESADIILLGDSIDKLAECFQVSRRTIRTIKQNLTWAFVYNVVGMVIAVSGYLNPLMAASAMLISSISVVVNSLRLHAGPGEAGKRFREILLPWVD